ncbi:type I restriction endonuclease [Nostoc sp. MS1]|uniref:type I restriction endonuclease n=1 Tax=Nostoc sp. MS1 TaxID=2764711 RepID=UPI001CC68FDF|nr:type I restriction endonuclease [Nostoc sp. MS1]BCL39013.1 hypothetical protein NSMS1_54600 [Nostoc sp. MS1]
MNPAQAKIRTVKASRLVRKLYRQQNLTPLITTPSPLVLFEVLGYTVALESDICFHQHPLIRNNETEVILSAQLHDALQQINPTIPTPGILAAIEQIAPKNNLSLLENNRRFQQFLTEGIDITYQIGNQVFHKKVQLIDRFNLCRNNWLVINPLTITEAHSTHILDIVVFINGLPLAVIIYTQPHHTDTTVRNAYQLLQTHKQQIPYMFFHNTFLVITNGNQAKIGTLTSEPKDFFVWRSIDGEDFSSPGETELDVLIQGIFDKRRFIELISNCIVFQGHNMNIKSLLCYPFCTI